MDKFTAIKREPCHKCDQPVFLAERFCVGTALYHRQCLKCARCGSQLKAGSFYETEVDGEFCCETCPDEEGQVMQRRNDSNAESDAEEKRFSVADKVALFQRVDLELTKKSLSDEEKRASLQRLASLTLVSQEHHPIEEVDGDEDTEASSNDSESEVETHEEPVVESNDVPLDTSDKKCLEIEEEVPHTLTDLSMHALIRQEVEAIVTSVLKEASEKVQLIQETERNNNEGTIEETDDKNDEVPLEVGPKPVPRIRTLERKKKEIEEAHDKLLEKSPKPPRPPPPVKEKPPIKPRPVSLTPKKMYPDDLNPFGSDDEEETEVKNPPKQSLNPFGSDTEEEVEIIETKKKSTNPFGSEDEEDDSLSRDTSGRDSNRSSKRTPVPTPRKVVNASTLSVQNLTQHSKNYGNHSLSTHDMYGSSSSLAYSDGMSTTQRRKKAKAPPPPPVMGIFTTPESNRSSKNLDYESEESNSSRGAGNTPNKGVMGHKKKRKAPAPPPIVSTSTPSKIEEDVSIMTNGDSGIDQSLDSIQTVGSQKLIPLSAELFDDSSVVCEEDTSSVTAIGSTDTYRRKIVPLDATETPIGRSNMFETTEVPSKVEEYRESNGHVTTDDPPICLNKSDKGKWKRRKGPAPSIPFEVRKSIKAMAPDDIKRELEVIEVQQLGLEKQGVMLEKIIREKCEGVNAKEAQKNSKAVEELIMQLFDVVNEKNELFRRQAELMYMRRQYRLESEQLELDNEIRKLMAEPEENKTDAEKAREEALIARLIEVVKQRNAVVDSLESDRIREKQEDASIRQSIERHAAKFEQFAQKAQNKLLRGKKEKKEKRVKDTSGSDAKPKRKKNVFNRLIHPKQKAKETEIKE